MCKKNCLFAGDIHKLFSFLSDVSKKVCNKHPSGYKHYYLDVWLLLFKDSFPRACIFPLEANHIEELHDPPSAPGKIPGAASGSMRF